MWYRLAADLVVGIHLGFVAYVVLGGLLCLRWRKLIWLHLPCAVWGALVAVMSWGCPLTPLENYFRRAAGDEGYTGGFMEQYLFPVLYPEGLTPRIQLMLGVFVILVNAGIYAVYVARGRRDRA